MLQKSEIELMLLQKGQNGVFSGWFTTKSTTKRKDRIEVDSVLVDENIFGLTLLLV